MHYLHATADPVLGALLEAPLDDEPETDDERGTSWPAGGGVDAGGGTARAGAVSWTVVLTASAQRDLRRLDRPVATRILDALARLADTGQGDVTRLEGTSEEWQLRVGDWRIRFRYDHPPNAGGAAYPAAGAGVPLDRMDRADRP